jgi:S-adenosylmethionine decarboxylase
MSGLEWLVEAYQCDPGLLRNGERLRELLTALIADLDLHPAAEPLWHQFEGPGGITGVCLLAESHFACHTFPEHGSMTVNLFCCRPRPDWDFEQRLGEMFGARRVCVRRLGRSYGRSGE